MDDPAWIEELSEQIAAIDAAFLAAPEKHKLHGHVAIAAYLLNFVTGLPGFKGDAAALADLVWRLEEMTLGSCSLKPIKNPKGGRAPTGLRDAIIQGRAAAGVAIVLRRGGKERVSELTRKAADRIAKHLRDAGHRGRAGKPITSATVMLWHETIAAPNAVTKTEAHAIYESALRDFENLPPAMTGDTLLRFVARIVAAEQSGLRSVLFRPVPDFLS